MTSARPETLQNKSFSSLPLGAIRPRGWLADQLNIQAEGLTGYLDEIWPSVSESAWKGGAGDSWERGPYYLDGLVPLAYLTRKPRLMEKVDQWIEPILASAQPSGWFGPTANQDRWPLSVALKTLMQYHEATGDTRVIPLLRGYFDYLHNSPPDWPPTEWRGVRAMETALTAYWLYERTGQHTLLEVVRAIHDMSFDWTSHFLEFPHKERAPREGFKFQHSTHVVNVAMAIKYPGLWYRQSADDRDRRAVFDAIARLDKYHGQVGGRFSGDEHLAGRSPIQGTELCAIVEYMFSLETLLEIFDDVALADRLEQLAYNGLPATCTPDFWAHQYDQQANQVLCSVTKRDWTNNGDESNVFGLEPNFGCCTANMHQGWPKFVSHLWMAAPDGGLAAIAYGPCEVEHTLADGTKIRIEETTEYPFDGTIALRIDAPAPVTFALHLRIPGWAKGASIEGESGVACRPGTFALLRRQFRPGESVRLNLPMRVTTERRYNDAIAVSRGPLVFGLRIGERFEKIKSHHTSLPANDWAIEATTPWNYGLTLDETAPDAGFEVKRHPIGPTPWANETAPVVLTGKGKLIDEWQIHAGSADETPMSPVAVPGGASNVELIPYGSTRLRISEFPAIAPD